MSEDHRDGGVLLETVLNNEVFVSHEKMVLSCPAFLENIPGPGARCWSWPQRTIITPPPVPSTEARLTPESAPRRRRLLGPTRTFSAQ